jgi:hypothetical protein
VIYSEEKLLKNSNGKHIKQSGIHNDLYSDFLKEKDNEANTDFLKDKHKGSNTIFLKGRHNGSNINFHKERDNASKTNFHKEQDYESNKNLLKERHNESITNFLKAKDNEFNSDLLKERYKFSNSVTEKELYQRKDTSSQQVIGMKRRISKKSIIGIGLLLVIVAVLLLFLNLFRREVEFTLISKNAIEVNVNHNKFKTYVFNTVGDLLYQVEKEVKPFYTLDHSAAVLIAMNGTTSYYVDTNHLIELQDKVNACNISEDGKYILYTRSGGMNNYFLYLYDVANQREEMLDNLINKQYDLLNVLPGGKTVTYVTYSSTEESTMDNIESYIIKDGGEPELVGKDSIIFSISTDSKNIYTYNLKDNALFVKHEGSDNLLSTEISNKMCFNIDYTEIIYNDDEASYISINGKERHKLADILVDKILIPKNGICDIVSSNGMVPYGIDSFHNKVIQGTDKSLVYITDKYKTKKIGMVANNPYPTNPVTVITEDGNNLLYIDSNNNLVKVHNLSGKWKQNTLAHQVDSFETSDDLSQIYYISENNLYFLKNKEEPVLISDNASNLCINQVGDTAYFLKNYTDGKGILYRSLAGNTAEPIQGGEDVVSVEEWNHGVIYQKYIKSIYSAFYNSKGREFTTLIDGFYITP